MIHSKIMYHIVSICPDFMRLSFAFPLKGVLEEMAEWDNDDDVFSG